MKRSSDQFFEEVYNPKLLGRIEKRFGTFRQHEVDLTVSSEAMLDMMRKMRHKPRRGEVVMVIPNEQGHLWLHTKTFYPQGIYRLMTGGLETGEKPDEAFLREVAEETGFRAAIDRCLAVITYSLTADDGILPFASYVFMTLPTSLRVAIDRCLAVITYSLTADDGILPFASYVFMTLPTSGWPQPSDPGEAIADFRAVAVESLPEVVHNLRSITGPFADWGLFRAIAHEVAYAALKE